MEKKFILEKKIKIVSDKNISRHTQIGKVYANLIESVCIKEEQLITILTEIYNSWITSYIEDYDSDFYYLPVDYRKCCYEEGKILLY